MTAEVLVEMRAFTLQGTETETIRKTLGDVEAKALHNTAADHLSQAKTETYGETLDDLKVETLVGRSLRCYSRRKRRHLAGQLTM